MGESTAQEMAIDARQDAGIEAKKIEVFTSDVTSLLKQCAAEDLSELNAAIWLLLGAKSRLEDVSKRSGFKGHI